MSRRQDEKGADVFAEQVELHLPGPTIVPPEVERAVQKALNHPCMDYRGPAFADLFRETVAAGKQAVRTEHDLLILSGSGAAALEAAMVNLVGPRDTVIVCTSGFFGEYLTSIASHIGAHLVRVEAPWGEAVPVDAVAEALAAHPDAKAVFATHCETSTGVVNDVRGMAAAVARTDAVFAVDAVSSLITTPLETDAWGIDMVLSASQKALMLPPGLSLISVSPKAWKAVEARDCASFYFDLSAYREFASRGTMPFTPNVPLVMALRAALKLILADGLEAGFRRHALLRDMARAGVRALNLAPLAPDAIASPTLTTVRTSDANAFREALRADTGIVLGGGLGQLHDQIVRIGHLGYTKPLDVLKVMAGFEQALAGRGADFAPGSGVAAAQAVWRERQLNGVGVGA